MKNFIVLTTAFCFMCTMALGMEIGMGQARINTAELDNILTAEIVEDAVQFSNAIRLENVKPHAIIILNAQEIDYIPPRTQELLQEALTISSGDTISDLKVTADWQKLKEIIPRRITTNRPTLNPENSAHLIAEPITRIPRRVIFKPTLLQRLTDPVTLVAALTTGAVVYYWAKNNNE